MLALSVGEYVVHGVRTLWRAGRAALETTGRNAGTRRCFVYTEVVLRRGGLLRFEHARGLSIIVGEGRLWLTQDHLASDSQLNAGQQMQIDGDDLALASTDRDTRVTLCGEVSDRRPWRITQVLRCGLRREISARDRDEDVLRLPAPANVRFAGC